MDVFAQLVFWISILALLHTYGVYPVLVRWMARGKTLKGPLFEPGDGALPRVSVLMSLYNEEKVIVQKLDSLLAQAYPSDKFQILIGSDASDDATNALVAGYAERYPQVRFFPFTARRGKPPVINDLAREALSNWPPEAGHVLLLTDASVLLQSDTLYRLVRHFRDPEIGVVDAHMRSTGLRDAGISRSEDLYLSGEVRLKNAEGRLWGKMIGPFGGCYALRSDLFEPVPPNALVDDFFLVFRVLERGYAAVNDLEAVCLEGATHMVRDEFRRKKRIAAGSFQNLVRFRRWVLPPFSILGFAFFSHKVLRWFGGFLMLAAWLSCGILAMENQFYRGLFWLSNGCLVLVPLLHGTLRRLHSENMLINNLYYFLAMNAALIAGFFQWSRGIKSNTWQRTVRY